MGYFTNFLRMCHPTDPIMDGLLKRIDRAERRRGRIPIEGFTGEDDIYERIVDILLPKQEGNQFTEDKIVRLLGRSRFTLRRDERQGILLYQHGAFGKHKKQCSRSNLAIYIRCVIIANVARGRRSDLLKRGLTSDEIDYLMGLWKEEAKCRQRIQQSHSNESERMLWRAHQRAMGNWDPAAPKAEWDRLFLSALQAEVYALWENYARQAELGIVPHRYPCLGGTRAGLSPEQQGALLLARVPRR